MIFITDHMGAIYNGVLLGCYNLVLSLVDWMLVPLSGINLKIKKWLKGRRFVSPIIIPDGKRVVWMHCSSLGEFEQGRPVLEGLRRSEKNLFIALTFFSPSGYDRMKSWPIADWVGYIPLDTVKNARSFVERIKPDLVLWVKYDFWFNHWRALHELQIPIFLIAAKFRVNYFPAAWWATPFWAIICKAKMIAVQDTASLVLLRSWGYEDVFLAGDTRVDRVCELAQEPFINEWIEQFIDGDREVLAGSIWEPDIKLLAQAIRNNVLPGWKWILAPHDIQPSTVEKYSRLLGVQAVHYTHSEQVDPSLAQVLLLDTIGMLNKVYRYGSIAYIGGGFGKSIHNILEPAAYGIPVLFGPRHSKFPEAVGMMNRGGGFEIRNVDQLNARLSALWNDDIRSEAGSSAAGYIQEHAGATERVLQRIHLLLEE